MKNYLETIMENTLKPEDTFEFGCSACGACCRKRKDPIALTGVDIFRISQALDCTPREVMMKYTINNFSKDSHLPVFNLRERDDGSCALLRKGKCMVHDNKPIVCAIYPLGRAFINGENSPRYFKQAESCKCSNSSCNKVWTLQEWLDNFNISELDDMSRAWNNMTLEVSEIMADVSILDMDMEAYYETAKALYLDYDIHQPYIEQVERNHMKIREILNESYNKKNAKARIKNNIKFLQDMVDKFDKY